MRLKKVKIGNLHTDNNVFLAPLAGYTNGVFRNICRGLGAGLTFTEMVSAKGLCYGSEKTETLLYTPEDYTGINAVQIFGKEPYYMRSPRSTSWISIWAAPCPKSIKTAREARS